MNIRFKMPNERFIIIKLFNTSERNIDSILHQISKNTSKHDEITGFVELDKKATYDEDECGNPVLDLNMNFLTLSEITHKVYTHGFNFILNNSLYIQVLNDDVLEIFKSDRDKGKKFLAVKTGNGNEEIINLGQNHLLSIQAFNYIEDKYLYLDNYIDNIEIDFNGYMPLKQLISLIKMSCKPMNFACDNGEHNILIYQYSIKAKEIVTLIIENYKNNTYIHSIHF